MDEKAFIRLVEEIEALCVIIVNIKTRLRKLEDKFDKHIKGEEK